MQLTALVKTKHTKIELKPTFICKLCEARPVAVTGLWLPHSIFFTHLYVCVCAYHYVQLWYTIHLGAIQIRAVKRLDVFNCVHCAINFFYL